MDRQLVSAGSLFYYSIGYSFCRTFDSSKDALIRVWDRKTLELAQTLQGHEGPVNAIGLQDGKVVSASGDGKMMLWDIATGTRIRTFEGHDRGLACIDFKVSTCAVSLSSLSYYEG